MTTVRDISGTQPLTTTDLLSQFLYTTLGLRSGPGTDPKIKNATCAIWFVIHSLGIVVEVRWWYRDLLRTQTVSSSRLAVLLTSFILVGSTAYFHAKIILLNDRVKLLHERKGRKFGEFFLQIAFNLPAVLIGAREAVASTNMESLFVELYYGMLQLHSTALFMISDDVLVNLRTSLNKILALTGDIDMNQDEIRRERWRFRDRIEEANRIFSWTWASHHVRVLLLAVFIVSQVLNQELGRGYRVNMVIHESCQLARLFVFAWKSSTLRRSCLVVEERFLNKIQVYEEGRQAARHMFPVVIFREEWDILWNGCFPLETRYFFSFLAVCVTFVAVILEFDHGIQRMINDAAANS